MRRFLLDTGIAGDFINHRRGIFERAQHEVSRGNPVGIGISVLAELVYGVEQSSSRDRNMQKLMKALATWGVWPFDNKAAFEYGRIAAELRRIGRPMQQVDIQIAAIAFPRQLHGGLGRQRPESRPRADRRGLGSGGLWTRDMTGTTVADRALEQSPWRSNTMSGNQKTTAVGRRPTRFRLHISLRVLMVLVALVGAIFAVTYRRTAITPRNVVSLAPIARLDKNDIWQIAWSPERDRMGVVGWEAPVEVRDAVSLAPLKTIGDGEKIIHFAFGPRGGVVAYSENDGSKTAVILDPETGKTVRVDAGGDQPDVVFSLDGKWLTTSGYGTSVRLWQVEDGRLIRTFDAGPVTGGLTPAFSPDGRLLAIGNRNATTGIFDVTTGDLLFDLPKKMSQELQFSPDGKTLAVVYVDASVALWQVADGSLIAERKTPAEELYTVDWSPDGSLLATAGLKGKITIWDPRDLSVLRELPAPEWVISVKFTPDGLNLHTAGGAQMVGGKRRLEILGIEGALFTLLHRPGAG